MSIIKIKKTIECWKTSCKDCGLEIIGSTRNQVEYNLLIHSMKHRREAKRGDDNNKKSNVKGKVSSNGD